MDNLKHVVNYGSWSYLQPTAQSTWGSTFIASPPTPGVDHLDTTYQQLSVIHEQNLSMHAPVSDQVLRNHKSTLRGFLTFCNRSLESRIGREFTLDFTKQARAYSEFIATTNRKTAADKLSILRAWKRTVDKHVRANTLKSMSGLSPFHKELKLAIASSGMTLPELAKAIHSSVRTLQSWLEGLTPIFNSVPAVRRLEKQLGLEPEFLVSKLHFAAPAKSQEPAATADRYERQLQRSRKDPYYVTTQMFSEELRGEWRDFLRFKTCQHPIGLNRGTQARWRVLPIEKSSKIIARETLCQPSPGFVCPTAFRNLQNVMAFLGFLTKAPSANPATSGLGLPLDKVQTLAMFAVPEFVDAFFEFVKARSDNIVHGGHSNTAGAISTLCRENEGYLWQKPEFFKKVEQFSKGRSWREMCAQTYQLCVSWHRAGVGRKSRDPKAALQNLLSLQDPLGPFKEAIKRLDVAAAAAPAGSIYQALQKRDALLLALCLFNPLRVRTLTIMKYVEPGKESAFISNLYQAGDGQWWLRFEKGDFKNDGSKRDDYVSPITRDLTARIENYLQVYRPVLTRNNPESPWVFPSKHGGQHADLGEIVSVTAKKYIPQVRRLGPHALRHIVATDFLRRNPGQYTLVAGLLHDTLETVLKTYAHGQVESAFKAHEEHMKGFYEGL